jgi:uncharacterized protein
LVIFCDTSALLKRYRAEQGTDTVMRLFTRVSKVVLAQTTRSEALSALNFHVLHGNADRAECDAKLSEMALDFEDFQISELSDDVEKKVAVLAAKYGHKALDNIQLASALAAKPRYFVTGDKKLARLAKLEKLKVKLV